MTTIIGPDVLKSLNDKRKYRHLTLNNQLTVILIEDEETEKSSACIDVGVGSMTNPIDVPGTTTTTTTAAASATTTTITAATINYCC